MICYLIDFIDINVSVQTLKGGNRFKQYITDLLVMFNRYFDFVNRDNPVFLNLPNQYFD